MDTKCWAGPIIGGSSWVLEQIPGRVSVFSATRFPSRSGARSCCSRCATVRGVNTEAVARPRLLRLTQARIGDTLHDGNGTRVAVVNAFTTVNPESEATVCVVDYQVVGPMAPDRFRVYSDDERDVARWRRIETPGSA